MAQSGVRKLGDSLQSRTQGGGAPEAEAVRPPKTGELVARRLRRMIVEGTLKDGDFLPREAELLEHFGVSRPTLREAVRVMESEGLVELRRGSRTGARITVPGPEAVARPAALQLQLGGATLADVYTARSAIEPPAARLLALSGDEQRYAALEEAIEEERSNLGHPDRFAVGAAQLHLRLVELSGNQTLAIMAGLVHEIILRQTRSAVHARHEASPASSHEEHERALRAYQKLLTLVRSGRGDAAEIYWREHLDIADKMVLADRQTARIIDILD
ncbi:FadR/GntR family transcriptional regulator [Peterkaempfera bronchialis]|uniref:FadR family transcriptional regulator n=1 Tax=Peterkaempfera bronchialis TaxID=2126346 RepID=A0A345SR49_9ACTN|nr:GntR family transcriptional regulator [Peterkaempfera bronchialis]AXI76204.1 FadR family transcriptional regulator [Peterkaempfera bronchialis]